MRWWLPIVSGLAAGLVTMGFMQLLQSRSPSLKEARLIRKFSHRYRWHLRFCTAVFIGSLIGAVLIYQSGFARSNEWWPLLIGFGFGIVGPISVLYLRLPRRDFDDFWTALVAHEGFKPGVMTAVGVLAAVALISGIGGYFGR